MPAEPITTDLPPRTWRQWWRQLPGYYRIGAWAAGGLIALQLALAVRIGIGLQEAREIRYLRQRGAKITYQADSWGRGLFRDPRIYEYTHHISKGLAGCSCGQVRFIYFQNVELSRDDLQYVCRHFPHVERLTLMQCRLQPDALAGLSPESPFHDLQLNGMDVDDRDVEFLASITTCKRLDLNNTLVSDASIPLLEAMPRLLWAYLGNTLVTPEALKLHQDRRQNQPPQLSSRNDSPGFLHGCVRWSDGRRSAHHLPQPFSLTIRDRKTGNTTFTHTFVGQESTTQAVQFHPALAGPNGDYLLTLRFGDQESEPVELTLHDRKASNELIEFRMPCTKAEALTERGASAP
jgi:hypothetical protein